jgi:hypothetical protein
VVKEARDVHRIALHELLALGHVLVRERHLVRAYVAAAPARPEALRRRQAVQRAARLTALRPAAGP